MIDESVISFAVNKEGGLRTLQQAGVTKDDFVDEYQQVWNYLLKMKRDHEKIPSASVVRTRFPDIELPNTKSRDIPILLHNLRQRRRFMEFLHALNDAAAGADSYENVDESIQTLLGKINAISFGGAKRSHLVDLFSPETSKKLRRELQRRRSGEGTIGIPTGLKRFDSLAGGLQAQKMITIIGRPGIGKSWLDLFFVAQAVRSGAKVILYPLEMTLTETAFRLYTLFSQQMFGNENTLKNYELTTGKISPKKIVRFLHALEDKFAGQLYVADVSSLADPYTNERIEAEVEVHKPDMFWVDYLTLLKPANSKGVDDWAAVRQLSNGIKNTAMRRSCVGGCSAQVSREALRSNVFLPRLEHIAYGDSIGQDADMVFSINRTKQFLYYALVKNRGGPEIGKTKLAFSVNEGIIEESANQEDTEED